ncbi:MAG TPA: proprotein convertase P-domain-containing protein [Thermoanaerobaculia bacterium]|nr:proprotein convertase P-domain-containing protein [Thermoanaerobaculia bacterium]
MLFAAAALALQLELVRHSLVGTHYRYGEYRDGVRVSEMEFTVEGVAARFSVPSVGLKPDATRIPARVFLANPVKTLNEPSLQDRDNSATAVPDAAYTNVELDDVNPSGPLGGPYAQIVDVQTPDVAPVDASQPLVFDRSQNGFEDVNAYFHVDRSQKYLQALGYAGDRTIAPYPVPIDTHAMNGTDDSIFVPSPTPGRGTLVFGTGGTDDAEEPDLVVHEYAHAIHEWISPGAFLGSFASEGRAISEGFADYWAFSASYAVAVQSGRDPFCFADWDARCADDSAGEHCAYPAGADCLRRLDSPKTIADFDPNEAPGTEYINGVIWSSALREIFVALTQRYGIDSGKRIADTIAIEALFGAPSSPSFAGVARKMIAADRYLNNGANADVICAAMTRRGILSDCAGVPSGELTLFQSVERGVPIPDNDPNGVTLTTFVADPRAIEHLYIRVDIDHPFRGDLRIVLIAPDGAEFVLQNPSADRSRDLRATYGRDAVTLDPLDALRGRSAAGTWKLRVADLRPRDTGTVLSWGVVVQFAGDMPAATRPTNASRQTIPIAGRIPGALGTFFTTDVRLLNRSGRDTTATLIFTPSGADGRTEFAAIKVAVARDQVIALNDVVGGFFSTEGIGQLEIDGDVVATSRTYTRNATGGTLGEAIAAESGTTSGTLLPLYVDDRLRTNLGFAETSGNGGTIHVTIVDENGVEVQQNSWSILPFSHLQVALTESGLTYAQFSSTTPVAAYASIVDNDTGDAALVRGQSGTSETGLAPAINAAGAFGTYWNTAFAVLGPGTLTLVEATGNRTTQTFASNLPAVGTPPVMRGLMSTAISVRSAFIANDGYRQSVPFIVPSDAQQDLAYVENSTSFRTNIGLMSDVESIVRVTLFDAAGKPLASSIHDVAPMQLDQFPIATPVTNGRVHIEVLSGRIAAYASVVDNITGDASFVPAQ